MFEFMSESFRKDSLGQLDLLTMLTDLSPRSFLVFQRSILGFLFVVGLNLCLSDTVRAAQLLGAANDYNVFTLGDFTQQGTDSLGRVAVGGKFDPGGTVGNPSLNGSGSYSVASNNPNQAGIANLVVGGNYRNGSTTINGNMVVGGTASVDGTVTGKLSVIGDLTRGYGQQGGDVSGGHDIFYTGPDGVLSRITATRNVTIGGGGAFAGGVYYGGTFTNNNNFSPITSHFVSPAPVPPTLPINFASEAAFLKTLSGKLDALSSTGTTTFTGNSAINTNGALSFFGTHSSQDIFHVNTADLAHTYSLSITGVAGETIVINIDGAAASMSNFGMSLSGVDRQHVLFNFYNGANTSTFTTTGVGIQGTVLAPFTNINFAGGNIDGTIIGNTIQGSGESHEFLFLGNVTFGPSSVSTPEPTTFVSGILGTLAAGILAYRRRNSV